MIVPLVALAAFLLLANATFVGAEFATVAARRSRLQQLSSAGDAMAATAIRHSSELPRTLAALQLGISAASTSSEGPSDSPFVPGIGSDSTRAATWS